MDVRSNHPDNPLRQGLIDKGLVDVHAIIEVPKGQKHPYPRYAELPDLESFARSDKERKLITMHRTFQLAGAPFVLPPGTPKERVEVLQEAMRRTFKDPEFLGEYKKTGDDSPPLMPEALDKVIKESAPRSGSGGVVQKTFRRRSFAAAVTCFGGMGMERELITIVNPTAPRVSKRAKLAPRKYRSLRHKRIGLLDNNKPNADKFLAQVGKLLRQRYEGVELISRRKMTRTGADFIQELADRCDVVINAFAD